jgi:hypothetical protein
VSHNNYSLIALSILGLLIIIAVAIVVGNNALASPNNPFKSTEQAENSRLSLDPAYVAKVHRATWAMLVEFLVIVIGTVLLLGVIMPLARLAARETGEISPSVRPEVDTTKESVVQALIANMKRGYNRGYNTDHDKELWSDSSAGYYEAAQRAQLARLKKLFMWVLTTGIVISFILPVARFIIAITAP